MDLFPEIGFEKHKFSKSSIWRKARNRRKFFEDFAKRNLFDPHIANNWYRLSKAKLMTEKGAKQVLSYHNGSLYEALMNLFPNIGLQKSKFSASDLSDLRKRQKQFLLDYAASHNFDPNNAENWYSVGSHIYYEPGSRDIFPHNHTVAQALVDSFPEIGLDKSRFAKPGDLFLCERKVLEEFAIRNGFSALNPSHWYLQAKKFLTIKGADKIILGHNNSVVHTLMDLFPEIGLVAAGFQETDWQNPKNRRNFFEEYAKENRFDARVAENWYMRTRKQIESKKGARRVLFYHEGSYPKALMDLFPDINFEPNRFASSANWGDAKNRRNFFEDFAASKGFDALHPYGWYLHSHDIIFEKGAPGVLAYHNNKIPTALADLFPLVQFDLSKFPKQTLFFDMKNRRKFFEDFAREYKFDPLIPENWYQQSRKQILDTKGSGKVLLYYSRSVKTALLDVFPEIGLEKMKFHKGLQNVTFRGEI
eukprot:Phypoly_transcript_00504.p2 GENE.Phypoly_transcript_00504~~Phypoly_transcript_00504.p2  ORF type:complete len:477 (+),score=71.61 Phypoly_transcript_00504:1867-3297(+)